MPRKAKKKSKKPARKKVVKARKPKKLKTKRAVKKVKRVVKRAKKAAPRRTRVPRPPAAPTPPTEPSPVTISETFSDSLNANGLRIHAFTVSRAGTVSAQLATLSDPAATVGLSIGTWNGAACQIVIVNPAAVLNTTVTGTAQAIGEFCVMLNDVGKLTTSVDYSVTVTHF